MIEQLEAAVTDDDLNTIDVTVEDAEDSRLLDVTGFANENKTPEVLIQNVPEDAGALYLETVHHEAAEVVDHPWIHWLVWDIDPTVTRFPADSDPVSRTDGYNDFLEQGWGGPSPPPEQDEPYRFRVYALDHELGLPAQTRRARIASTIGLENEILATGETIVNFDAEQGTVFVDEGVEGLRP